MHRPPRIAPFAAAARARAREIAALSLPAVARLAGFWLVLAAVSGCGDDGTKPAAGGADAASAASADVGDLPPLPTFTAAADASGPRVRLEGGVQSDGQIAVDVVLRDFQDLYGIAGHLRYDPAGLELVSLVGQPILGGAGYVGRVLASDSPAGRILLGGARIRTSGDPWEAKAGAALGKQLWATAVFRVRTPGTYALTFDPDSTLARQGDYTRVEPSWQGATIDLVGSSAAPRTGGEG